MYLLLTWVVDPGPTAQATVEAEVTARIAGLTPQCILVPGSTRIFPSTGGDAEYEDLLDDLIHISEAFDNQLRFALVKSRERNLDGAGFDLALAQAIIK